MYTRLSYWCVSILTPLCISLAVLGTPVAYSHAVTNSDIHDQKLVVMGSLVDTLREQVKLLQLMVINRLETRVAQLQQQIDTR